jgi:hypothetical protein
VTVGSRKRRRPACPDLTESVKELPGGFALIGIELAQELEWRRWGLALSKGDGARAAVRRGIDANHREGSIGGRRRRVTAP